MIATRDNDSDWLFDVELMGYLVLQVISENVRPLPSPTSVIVLNESGYFSIAR